MSVERFPAARADMPDISADLISGRRFAQTWRGYDPEEVKEFLAQVAEQVRTLRERLDIEVSARREADQRALHPRIDEATLMSAVGEETAAILRTRANRGRGNNREGRGKRRIPRRGRRSKIGRTPRTQ